MTNRKRCILKYLLKQYQKVKDQRSCYLGGRGIVSINAVKSLSILKDPFYVYSFTVLICAQLYTNLHNSQVHVPWCVFKCISGPLESPSETTFGTSTSQMSQASLKASLTAASQDSNSLSLLTEMSGVDAPVSRCSVSSLQSLASGLPKWRGELGNMWAWWRCSWLELLVEFSEGAREGSCCSLCGTK